MEEQRLMGVKGLNLYAPESGGAGDGGGGVVGLEAELQRLSLCYAGDDDGGRRRRQAAALGGDVAAEEGGWVKMMRAHNGYGDLGYGGPDPDLNPGQVSGRGSGFEGISVCAASSSAAVPLLRRHLVAGDEALGAINGERLNLDHDPFLLRTKSHCMNPTTNVPILKSSGVRGKILSLAKDQTGCRIFQHSLNFWSVVDLEVVLPETIHHLIQLMKNQYGSYLIQKFFSICSQEQRLRIVFALTSSPLDLISICLNSFGARCMMKILEAINSQQQRLIVARALSPGAVTLACDSNGHLVVSFCLTYFPFEFNEGIINVIARNFFEVATNVRGCRVMQYCLENAQGESRKRLVIQIIANSVQLSEDPYGNYVVQHLFEQNIPGVEEALLRYFEGKFTALACNKFSSNVVEKLIARPGENSTRIIRELIRSHEASKLLVHPFANYVIQKALKVATGDVFIELIYLIRTNALSLKNNKHGRKIIAYLEN